MAWRDALKERKEIVLITCNKGKPHGNIVLSLGLENKKLLLGACQMYTTLENLRKNNFVCLITKYKKEYYRFKGRVKLYEKGPIFIKAQNRNKGPKIKTAILINIEEIFDLDKVKKIKN